MEVKISTKKKSGNDIACFNENRKMLDHIQASIHKEQIKASPSNMSNTHFPPLQIIPIYIYIYIYIPFFLTQLFSFLKRNSKT